MGFVRAYGDNSSRGVECVSREKRLCNVPNLRFNDALLLRELFRALLLAFPAREVDRVSGLFAKRAALVEVVRVDDRVRVLVLLRERLLLLLFDFEEAFRAN